MVREIQIQGLKELQSKFKRLRDNANDMRPAFEIIASDFYKSNKPLIFSARPGKYADLSENYKAAKEKKYGFVYPVLVANGRLERSLTVRGSEGNITNISKQNLKMGSNVRYAVFLQEGTKKMPARPPVLIDIDRRVQRWLRIIEENTIKGV